MPKELVLAGILLCISTVLKICSVIALCNVSFTIEEPVHPHEEHHIVIKKEQYYTQQLG
jgi:hypothetical protein